MNSQQIADLDKTHRERHNGQSLSDALSKDDNLPKETKDALAIYLKGTDKITPADTIALADIGLKAKNQEIFQEAFRGATPEARAQFLAQGGEQKVTEAFGSSYTDDLGNTTYSRNSDVDGAMDYVKKGKLDAFTKISDNTSVLGDNEEAIELSLAQMTAAERKSYADGKVLAAAGGDATKLAPADKESFDYYNKVHTALDKAGNDREMAKWEDLIASGKDGSLVNKLAAHGGMIDDSMDKYLGTIEDMSKSDWERLKKDPEYRKQVEATLAIDLSDSEMTKAREALDKKMSGDTFEGSHDKQRSVVDSIKDKSGFWNDDEKGIIGALEKMTAEEQRRYRDDPAFKKELDTAIAQSMDFGAESNAAKAILEKVAKGEKPESNIISKLEMHSTAFNIDEAKVIADVEDAFRKDPTLRERMNKPQTPEDKEMAQKFDIALRKNLTPYEYDKFAKPLLETGRLSMEVKADLYKGVFNDDEQGFYDSLKKDRSTAQDWKEVLDNPDKVMSFLSKEEREVALNIARQKGEIKPEDHLRAAMLGAGTEEAKIKEVLGAMNPEQKLAVKAAYELKYGSNLSADVLGELGGSDKVEAARTLRENQTARQAYNDARTEVSESADGIGRKVVRGWDGTSQMTQDQLEQYSKAMADYSQQYKEMPAENLQKFEQDVYKALELYKKSESAAADTIVDGAIIAAGVGGAAFTGGVSLSLLAATSVGGALFKVGAKSAIMGADYDFNSAQVVSDGATGAIDAATIFLGPAQAAQMLKLGEKSAVVAARGVLSQADNIAVASGRQLLKEGASETLEKGMKQKIAVAISNGAESIDAKALKTLAENVATSVDDVPMVQKMLADNLNQAIKAEATQGLKKNLTELALNTGAGSVGGMLSGGVRGGVDGESIDAVLQQGMSGIVSGGVMAGGFTLAFKGMGKGISHLRHGDGPAPRLTSDPTIRVGGDVAPTPKLDVNGRISEYPTPSGKVAFEYHNSGALTGEVKKVSLPNGLEYSSKDGANWTVKDPTVDGGKYEVKGAMKVDSEGTMHWQAEGGNKSSLRNDGSRVEIDRNSGREVTASYLGQIEHVKDGKHGVDFKYDSDGRVTNAKFDNGTTVERTAEGKTLLKRADGAQEELTGKLSVARDGRLFLKAEDGASFRSISADGSSVHVDVKTGRISEAMGAQGEHYKYTYNTEGDLTEIHMPDGEHLKKDADGFWEASRNGDYTGTNMNEYKVTSDGELSYAQGERRLVHGLDGKNKVYDTSDNKLLFETGRDKVRADGPQELSRIDGRPVEFQEKVRDKFKHMNNETREKSVGLVSHELGDVRAIGADGNPTSAYDSLMSDPTLSDRQKANILDNLAEVREHFASYRSGDRMHSDPEVNWIHTQGELAKVLEAGRKKGLAADQMEDALLASMYSDSVKFAFPPPKGADANFFTHHLDGALAAHEALTKKGFPLERVDRIVQAIKEHQIAPPEFMGNLYLNAKIKPSLEAQLKSGAISPERHAELTKVLKEMTVVGPDNVPRLKPMAQVNDWPKVRNADGSWEVALTPDQRELFKMAGIERWSTPVNPVETPGFKQLSMRDQEKLVSQYKISTTLIDGDAVDNYATLGGASKIVTIRGPETNFKDGNVWQSIDSIDSSYKDAYQVLSPEGRQLADASLAQRNALLNDENGIKAQMNEWLASRKPPIDAKDVVYLQKDGKLKYPEALTEGELDRFNKLYSNTSRGPILDKELKALKYKGMTDDEIMQYELAKEVRAKMADLMRAGHRVDDSLPGNFPQAKVERQGHPDWLQSKSEPLPEATGPVVKSADGSSITPTKDGTILKTSDGFTQVTDKTNGTVRTYDDKGRVVQAIEGPRTRSFEYGEDSKLSVFTMESGDVIRKNSDGDWIGPIKQDDGSVKEDIFYKGEIVADGNGSIRYVDEFYHKNTTEAMDGSRIVVNNGRTEYLKLSLATESANLGKLARDSFPDAARWQRFDNFVKEFEAEAVKRDMPEQQKANFYKQVNRLLEPNPAAVLTQAERADLAEQLMSHSVKPTTVDQGCNSTCNVTTLEVRNYARDPEKNAQLLADIATEGKFTTANGTVVDMTALEHGLRPDAEARRANRLQQKSGDALKKDGSRDWSSQILETAMVNSYWQGHSHIIIDGQRVLQRDLAFDNGGNLIGRLKKGSNVSELYNAKGEQLGSLNLSAGEKAYTKSGKEITGLEQKNLVYGSAGELKGMTAEQSVVKVFDQAGKPLKHLESGVVGYDETGKRILKVSQPGDIKYEKSVTSSLGAGERVLYKDGDLWLQLKDRTGETMDAPSIYTSDLEGVNRSSTGVEDSGYMLTRGDTNQVYAGMQDVSTAKELGDALLELEKQGKLPAVIQVHTAAAPFSQLLGIESALGWGGGWHVVNVHGYDPATGMVKFSNQWGSSRDYMDKGYPIDKLFKSMKEPVLYKFMTTKTGRTVQTAVGAGVAGYLYSRNN